METATLAPLVHSVEDACRKLHIGRTFVYRLIGDGSLKTIRLGKRRLIPESEIQRLIADRMVAADRQGGAQ